MAELSDVTVRRGINLLLDNVNIRVNDDERWVIIGPNGAGKTTMLQVLSTQLHPTSGTVQILGEYLGKVDVWDLRPAIGVTSPALAKRIPNLELVKDVVVSASYGVIGRWSEEYDDLDYARAHDLMVQFRVDHLADRRFGTLSEGERKRAEVARALMTDPELLLLDEPGSGLDLGGRELLVATLSQLASDPFAPTMIMVTHHLEEIPPGVTHAVLLDQGKVAVSGAIGEVLTSENLSQVYQMPLTVGYTDGRWRAQSSEASYPNH